MKLYSDTELAILLDNDLFHRIGRVADDMGVECYVVGGYVRDLFLERPSNDIDIVVVGSGIEVATQFKQQMGRSAYLSVFHNFGTAQVKMKNGIEVEFVGARRESYNRDSRKPIVEDGTLEDDQNRRDFTINAMAICLNSSRFGELVDPFNGLADLEDGIIATPLDPEITFSDDPLRMLRCIRFATQLNFQIEDATFVGLEHMASRISIVSAERIATELNKIILSKVPSRGFVDLQRSGLLQIILPELAALDIVEQKNGRAHKNNFYHTLEVLDNVACHSDNLWLRWAALLHDIGKTHSKRWDPLQGWTFHNHNSIGVRMVQTIFRRLKLPLGQEMHLVEKLVDLHMRPQAIADEEVTDSAVRRLINDAGEDIDDLMTLCEADITSKNEVKKKIFLENFRMVREKLTDLKEKDYKRLLQPVIDGNEIMELFNLKPSREVGILKQYLKDAVLDNRVENAREPLMQLLMEKARQLGLQASRTLLSIMIAVILIGCAGSGNKKVQSSVEAEDEAELTEENADVASDDVLPKGAEELFDDFMFYFASNERLQRHRIDFPLNVQSSDEQQQIADSAWVMDPFFMIDGEYTLIFDSPEQMELVNDTSVNQVVVEKIYLSRDSVRQYMFSRQNGRWSLDELRLQALDDNHNASFLDFYRRFVSDSLFQHRSLCNEIEFSGPDPDDDFNQMEGFITPDSWGAFMPFFPQDSIYNIVYGKQDADSRQKIFVIRGIGDEEDIELTFQLEHGKWKLAKLTE